MKRTILSSKQKEQHEANGALLSFKWTVSRGRYSYGYNICSLYVDGKKVASCNGGGYDMKGTVLANWVESVFYEELKKLKPADFYGLSIYNKNYKRLKQFRPGARLVLDGACGFPSIERILQAIGFYIRYKDGTHYTVMPYKARSY